MSRSSLATRIFTFLLLSFLVPDRQLLAEESKPPQKIESAIAGMSLEDLSEMDVETVTGFPSDPLFAPGSATVIPEEQWRKRGARRMLDALEGTPGVYVADSFVGTQVPNFRGFAGLESFKGFSLRLDGVPLNMYTLQSPSYAFAEIPLGNLESIEVARGPGSALYGTDSFYGTVSLKSWSPEEDVTEAFVEGGVFQYHSETVRTSQALVGDWRFTLIGSYQSLSDRHQDFRFTDTTTGETVEEKIENSYYSQGYTGKISNDIFEFGYSYLDHSGRETPGQPEVLFQGLFNGTTSNIDSTGHVYRARFTPQLTDALELDAKTYYTRGTFQGLSFSGPRPDIFPIASQQASLHKDQRGGIDIAVRKPFADSNYQALFGYSLDLMDNRAFESGSLEGVPVPGAGIDRDINSAYGQLEFDAFDERVRFTLGGRYDYYSDFGNQFTPRTAAVISLTENSALKFMYGRAFRAPALIEQIGNPNVLRGGGRALSPEVSDTYEVAWNYRDEAFHFGITGFYTEVDDGIQLALNDLPGEPFKWDNVGELQSLGTEVEAGYQIGEMSFSGNYSFARAQQRQPVSNGELFQAFPKHMVSISSDWTPTESLTLSLNNLTYFSFSSFDPVSVTADFENEPLGSLWRTDLHVAYETEIHEIDSEFYITIQDLFDRQDTMAVATGMEEGVIGAGFSAIAGLRIALY